MKHRTILLIFKLLIFVTVASGQLKSPPMDKSPMDMSYYPANYPVLKIQNKITEPLVARVIYSRPQKNGRSVYGELVEYGKLWRLGANEATEIEFYKDVQIGGNKLKKGRYTMYAIPIQDKWTIIFNKELDSWGAFQYDQKKDVLRIDAKTEKTDPIDVYSMYFEKANGGANLIIAWDDTKAILPFSFDSK